MDWRLVLPRVRVVRCHRPDSWVRAFVGEVFVVESAEPSVQPAAVYGAPWVEEEVLGWDVDMAMLTESQLAKVREMTDNLVIGSLFIPEEAGELLR